MRQRRTILNLNRGLPDEDFRKDISGLWLRFLPKVGTLQASGNLSLKLAGGKSTDRSIQWEIRGDDVGNFSLVDAWDESDAEFKYGESLPKQLTDWYGYSHTPYGQCGGVSDGTRTGYLYNGTSYYYISTSDLTPPNYKFTAGSSPLNTRVYKTNTGTAFVAGDKCIAYVYRRQRGDTGSWTLIQQWVPPSYYLSEVYNCDFVTYNYYWYIIQGA